MVDMSGVDARVEAQLEALGVARVAAQRAGAAAQAFFAVRILRKHKKFMKKSKKVLAGFSGGSRVGA